MQTVSHDGRETAYRRTDFGSDPAPVLFVHGSGATHELWTHQYGRRENAYPAVAVDLSGHGDSKDVDTAAGPKTLDAYVADVEAVVRETGASVLVGNSLGGAVVLTLVLDGSVRPDGIVLAGTGAKLAVHADLRELLSDDFDEAIEFLHGRDMLFHDPTDDQVEHSKSAMRETGRRITERDFLSCHTFDVRDRLGDVSVPTLALVGEHDRLTPPASHEFLAEAIPDAEYRTIDRAAHLAMVERPAAFAAAIDAFVDGL